MVPIPVSDTENRMVTPPPPEPQSSLTKMVPIPFSDAENRMLTKACSAADAAPRSIRRPVNVLKIMKIIWHHQQAEPDDQLKPACVLLLAMCASRSNTLLRRMRAFFDEMENSTEKIQTQSNLKLFMDKVAGAAVPKSVYVDTTLETVIFFWKQ